MRFLAGFITIMCGYRFSVQTSPLPAPRRTILIAGTLALSGVVLAAEAPTIDLARWTAPDIATVGDDPLGKLVKYGHALVTDTANQIGPTVSDQALRFAGNNLNCQSCHLKGGTQAYAMPLVGVWGQFPQYRGREGDVVSLEVRINGCLERSMNGRALPFDGPEMKAFLAYIRWLSAGIPDGARLVGAGTLPVKEPGRAADLRHGAKVYAELCAVCHAENGQGQRAESGAGYRSPPLWGPDSYNNGAGMDRLLTAAAFVKHNMPFGTTFDAPLLTDDDAYDVAAYINSQPRPEKPNLERDYPNRLQKPVDTANGPFADGFRAEQHKYGPYEPIRARREELSGQSK
jgi:thiosulfate dehydrogenase